MKNIVIPVGSSKTQYFINQTYVDYINNFGYAPILVTQSMKDLSHYIEESDGLLLPGGVDVDPIYYGENNYSSRGTEPEKDEFERILFHMAIKKQKPILGICRGFQLIAREIILEYPKDHQAIMFNQHISGHSIPDSLSVSRKTPHHDVMVNAYSLWAEGKPNTFERRFVNSMHHQGLMINSKDLISNKKNENTLIIKPFHGMIDILAYTAFQSEKDMYIIEAFTSKWEGAMIVGVQWHPEELNDGALLRSIFGEGEQIQNETKSASKNG